jgi:hypothetical protein
MSHMIAPPRADLTYAVIDDTGTPRSWHRSEAAAQAAVGREWRAFRRRYPADGSRGNQDAYLPRSIIHCPEARHIMRTDQYSTAWQPA